MDDEFRARAQLWVERSCAEQGVPLHVDDGQALAAVVALLGVGRPVPGASDSAVEMRAA